MAAPTKLTPARRKIVLSALKAGMSRYAAAGRAGVVVDTLQNWIADPRNSGFSSECLLAEQQAAAGMEAVIIADARKKTPSVDAAMRWLSKRRREDWGDKQQVEHSGSVGGVTVREVIVEFNVENASESAVPEAELEAEANG